MDLTFAGIAIGLGLIIIGTSYGISHVGGKAMDAMARQPDIADKARLTSLIIAAFIEGAALFAILICLLITNK